MKLLVPLSLALLLPALPVPAPGAPEPAPRPRLSDRLNQQFRTTLPEFKPAPARLDRAADPAPDPEVIELPEVVVREPRATPLCGADPGQVSQDLFSIGGVGPGEPQIRRRKCQASHRPLSSAVSGVSLQFERANR